jgi:signal peptidase I
MNICLGDNRVNSQDSRYIGTIPYKNIIGKAIYVVFPLNNYTNLND